MKKNTISTILALILGFSQASLQGQNAGCDGMRYMQDVFASVKMTTVQYCTTTSHTGLPITLSMDVYEPMNDVQDNRPVIILAHGGSFVAGDRTLMKPWCERLAKKGYVAATMSYRLYPVFTLGFPDSLDIMDTAVKAMGDMKAAIRYFRKTAAEGNQWHINPDMVFVGGYSAGAVAALHVGFMDESDQIPDFVQTAIDANGGFNGSSGDASNQSFPSEVKAVLNMSGGLYRREWVGINNVPMFSIHGTSDQTVPYLSGLAAGIMSLHGSGLLHPVAQSVGLNHFLETVPGAGHTNLYDPNQVQYKDEIDTFFTVTTQRLEAIICTPVPTTELDQTGAWSVYPNPAQQSFALRLPTGVASASVQVFNALGQAVLSLQNVQNEASIQATELGTGIFTIQMQDSNRPEKQYPAQQIVLF